MSNIHTVKHSKVVRVVDENGCEIRDNGEGATRTFHNSSWGLFGDPDVIIVKWSHVPGEEELADHQVTLDGAAYACIGTGSMAKDQQFIYVNQAIPRLNYLGDMLQFDEQVGRMGRVTPDAMYGAARGDFDTLIVHEAQDSQGQPRKGIYDFRIGPYTLADGIGLCAESVYRKLNSPLPPVIMGRKCRESYMYYNWFSWNPALHDELAPYIQRGIETLNDPARFVVECLSDADTKRRFYEAEPEMQYHPSIASYLGDAWAERAFDILTAVQTGEDRIYVLIPSPTDDVILPDWPGRKILYGYPIQSPGCILPIENPIAGRPLVDWCRQVTVFQHSFVQGCDADGKGGFAAKGMFFVVPDDEMAQALKQMGYPDAESIKIVIGSADFKLASATHYGGLSGIRQLERVTFTDCMIMATNIYGPGSCMAVPPAVAYDAHKDFDGDMEAARDGLKFPEQYRQACALPRIPSQKIKKEETPYTRQGAIHRMVQMAEGGIGIVINSESLLLAYGNVADAADMLGWNRHADKGIGLLKKYNYWVQCMTDVYKTPVPVREILEVVQRLNAGMKMLGLYAPWLDNTQAGWRARLETGVPDAATIPDRMQGVVPHIAREILKGGKVTFPNETFKMKPLALFRDWAEPSPDEPVVAAVKRLLAWYRMRVGRVNLGSVDAWLSFRLEAQAYIQAWRQETGIDPYLAANTLWYLDHSGEHDPKTDAGGDPPSVLGRRILAARMPKRAKKILKKASAVFVMFPDEAARICAEKPGLKRAGAIQTIVLGIGDTLGAPPAGPFSVEVKSFTDKYSRIRAAVCTTDWLPGQHPAGYPFPNCIGSIAHDAPQVPEGLYTVSLTPRSAKSWAGVFMR